MGSLYRLFLVAFPADGRKGVGVPLPPRFSALPWWLLGLLRFPNLKAFPRWGKVPPKEADEGPRSAG